MQVPNKTIGVLLLFVSLCLVSVRAADVPIVRAPDAPSSVRLAAQDLANDLGRLYPQDRFSITTNLPATGKAILLGSVSDALVRAHLGSEALTNPESFVVRTQLTGGLGWASSRVRMRAVSLTGFTNCSPNLAAASI